jgi:hypothetical protein
MYDYEIFLTLRREQKLKIFIKIIGKALVYAPNFAARLN